MTLDTVARTQVSEVWSIEYQDQEQGWSVHARAYSPEAAKYALQDFREALPHVEFRCTYERHESLVLGW